ncbi:hypothetical protein K432DRAFT_80800 [Lepidopterella palustris CBS 459.81]|uniref:Uncharacterized protein n=1 Tax=Lepidopterella palustris CBS 459.81 TaxID=1314670 RepID=A0A8E2E821_9PEZI|nr:hypothetical protein K432DRAFT_80800 [Lepidopterella palustris CBS 459.81]
MRISHVPLFHIEGARCIWIPLAGSLSLTTYLPTAYHATNPPSHLPIPANDSCPFAPSPASIHSTLPSSRSPVVLPAQSCRSLMQRPTSPVEGLRSRSGPCTQVVKHLWHVSGCRGRSDWPRVTNGGYLSFDLFLRTSELLQRMPVQLSVNVQAESSERDSRRGRWQPGALSSETLESSWRSHAQRLTSCTDEYSGRALLPLELSRTLFCVAASYPPRVGASNLR